MNSNPEETRGIKAIMVFEAIGRPPEHLTETLKNLVDQIDKEEKVQVLSQKISEPILMKEEGTFHTAFVEVELEVEQILHLSVLLFKYMPAHVEILSPELIALTNNGWNDLFNELARRLHGYDEVARILQSERTILEKKLKEILEGNSSKPKKPVKKKSPVKSKKKTPKKVKKK